METVVSKARALLDCAKFDWAVCGGGAVDLFLGKHTRPHQDLDIAVFWEDRNSIIRFMLESNWRVLEACGGGKVRELSDPLNEADVKRNLFCFTRDNTLCRLEPSADGRYSFSLGFQEQTEFNYLEFLFNKRDDNYFYYARNDSIKRPISKTIMDVYGVPVLAPEIVLLYKSTYYNYINRNDAHTEDWNMNHRHDFTVSLPLLSLEQKLWLKSALEVEYRDGHEWLHTIGLT